MEHPSLISGSPSEHATPPARKPFAYPAGLLLVMGLAVGLVALACYAGLGTADSRSSSEAGQQGPASAKSPEQAIKLFVVLAEKGQIDKVVVYYRLWERLTFTSSVREDDLIRAADLEVTHRGPMLQKPVLILAKTVGHRYLTRRKNARSDEVVDFGLGFICYSGERETIRVAISKRPPILSVNGEHFILPPEILPAMAPLLPPMVYKGMLLHIVTSWAPEGPWHELPKDPNQWRPGMAD